MTTEDAIRARLKLGALTHSEVIRTGGAVAMTLLRRMTGGGRRPGQKPAKNPPVKFAYLDVGGARQCVYYMEAP